MRYDTFEFCYGIPYIDNHGNVVQIIGVASTGWFLEPDNGAWWAI